MTILPEGPDILVDLAVAIDPAEVLRFQGYKRGGDVPAADVRALFDEALALGRRLMTPRAVVHWLEVVELGPDTIATREATLTIPDIARHWGRLTQVGAAVCTIGDALEREVTRLWQARELPLAMMLDSVGSGAVESLAEYVNDLLCQRAVPFGLRVTNRISPGYAGWDVVEQALLFRLVPAALVGVTLNEACVMLPGKSISLLVGAGTEARVDHYFAQCARCWMRDCAYRRVPMARSVRRERRDPP